MTDKVAKAPVKMPVKTVAIDFDGTLCDHAFPDIGPIKFGAREAMMQFKELGYYIIIYSCRTSSRHQDIFGGGDDPSGPTMERKRVKEMIEWLDKNGIPYDEIDDGSMGKPLADYYCDDRAIEFKNNWPQIAARFYLASKQ